MITLYEIFLIVGIIYILISLLFGGVFDFLNIDGDLGLSFLGVFKPVIIICFLLIVGGVGLFGEYKGFNSIIVLIVAVAIGVILAYCIEKFIFKALKKAENTSTHSQRDIKGAKATVISPIIKDGFGTIAYVIEGNIYNAPAKATGGERIEQGEEVVINKIENSVYYVTSLNLKED
ncbi:NfeD family protein [Clostridium sp.]|uniref:NfeD family protein n=1 Tax=Clostridium sp. TaxID=1506 RepID=UPI0034643769